MIIVDPSITLRISEKLRIDNYPHGIEIVGVCRLTGKTVIRYLDTETAQVFEFDPNTEDWIPMVDGICKDYFNQFASVCLPRYENNLLEYHKVGEEDALN